LSIFSTIRFSDLTFVCILLQKGLPTHDIDGKELSKGLLKKLQKQYEDHEKKSKDHLRNGAALANGDAS
jgi:hypothetical protein